MARTQGHIELICETLLDADSDSRNSVQGIQDAGLIEGTRAYALDQRATYELRPYSGQFPDNAKVVTSLQNRQWDLVAGGPDPVEVRTLSDLPAPVAAVITLPDNTKYLIVGQVDMGANRIVMGQHCSIYGLGPNIGFAPASQLIFNNTVAAITMDTGDTFSCLENLSVRNDAGPCLAWGGTGGYVRIYNCCMVITDAGPVASFAGAVSEPDLDLVDTKFLSPDGAGAVSVALSGVWGTVRAINCLLGNGDGIVIATGATLNEYIVSNCRFTIENGYTGLVQTDGDPGCILVGARMLGSVFRGAGTAADAQVLASALWAARGNIGVADY
jgi:hypothetical protein